jgi:hypothetical protein
MRIGLLYSLADDDSRSFRACDAVFVREAKLAEDAETLERWGRARVVVVGSDDAVSAPGAMFVTGSTGEKLARGMLSQNVPKVYAVAKSKPKTDTPADVAVKRINDKGRHAEVIVISKTFASRIYDTQTGEFREPGKVVTREIAHAPSPAKPPKTRNAPSIPRDPVVPKTRNAPSIPAELRTGVSPRQRNVPSVPRKMT